MKHLVIQMILSKQQYMVKHFEKKKRERDDLKWSFQYLLSWLWAYCFMHCSCNGYLVSIVDTDGLVLWHQGISSNRYREHEMKGIIQYLHYCNKIYVCVLPQQMRQMYHLVNPVILGCHFIIWYERSYKGNVACGSAAVLLRPMPQFWLLKKSEDKYHRFETLCDIMKIYWNLVLVKDSELYWRKHKFWLSVA